MIADTQIFAHASWLRGVQVAIADSYSRQLMRCPVHLSIGQELLWSCIKHLYQYKLKVFSTHRGHLPYLTLDGNLRPYVAELHLHQDGISAGNLGSMHMKSPLSGHITSVPIVGSSIPLAVGAAYAARQLSMDWIAVAHFGDGACEEGILHESLNLAAVKNLPILFLCENNHYSCTTSLTSRQPSERMNRFADAACIRSDTVNANDLSGLLNKLDTAMSFISSAGSPYFLEVECYRLYEHCGPRIDTDSGDRTPNEYQNAYSQDLLARNLDQSSYDSGYSECLALVDYYSEINNARKSAQFV